MRRVMVFIDGTNLLTEMGKRIGASYSPFNPSEQVIKLAGMIVHDLLDRLEIVKLCPDVVVHRKYWFASHQGNEHTLLHLRSWLRRQGFESTVLRKNKDKNEKGVDVALTREMLINAFNHNYEIAILISGDEDYVGLVNDTKRLGPVIYGSFFNSALSQELKLSFDQFEELRIGVPVHKELIQDIIKNHRKPSGAEH
jgi:hypothetical protein